MQLLDLDPLKTPVQPTRGVGGVVLTYFADVLVELRGQSPILVYAGFTEGLETVGVGLLGQVGFFDRFNVHFKLRDGICNTELLPD